MKADPFRFSDSARSVCGCDQVEDLGPCFVCGKTQDGSVRTLVCLSFEAPAGFVGWGCVVCGLPSRGAMAIACDACCDRHGQELPAELKFICTGAFSTEGKRTPLDGFARIPFDHDLNKHPAELECIETYDMDELDL
jgi:hypothetical protein